MNLKIISNFFLLFFSVRAFSPQQQQHFQYFNQNQNHNQNFQNQNGVLIPPIKNHNFNPNLLQKRTGLISGIYNRAKNIMGGPPPLAENTHYITTPPPQPEVTPSSSFLPSLPSLPKLPPFVTQFASNIPNLLSNSPNPPVPIKMATSQRLPKPPNYPLYDMGGHENDDFNGAGFLVTPPPPPLLHPMNNVPHNLYSHHNPHDNNANNRRYFSGGGGPPSSSPHGHGHGQHHGPPPHHHQQFQRRHHTPGGPPPPQQPAPSFISKMLPRRNKQRRRKIKKSQNNSRNKQVATTAPKKNSSPFSQAEHNVYDKQMGYDHPIVDNLNEKTLPQLGRPLTYTEYMNAPSNSYIEDPWNFSPNQNKNNFDGMNMNKAIYNYDPLGMNIISKVDNPHLDENKLSYPGDYYTMESKFEKTPLYSQIGGWDVNGKKEKDNIFNFNEFQRNDKKDFQKFGEKFGNFENENENENNPVIEKNRHGDINKILKDSNIQLKFSFDDGSQEDKAIYVDTKLFGGHRDEDSREESREDRFHENNYKRKDKRRERGKERRGRKYY